jgi:hypothetical protein
MIVARHFVPGYDRIVPPGRGPAGGLSFSNVQTVSGHGIKGANCRAPLALTTDY